MALDAQVLGGLIDQNLQAMGAIGSNRIIFSNAIALGVVQHISGKPFVTVDVGVIPALGNGNGIGTGIMSLDPATMTQIAISVMISTGYNAFKLMSAIMNAVVQHLSTSATLTTVNVPVFLGTGTVTVGSIGVDIPNLKEALVTALRAIGANGYNLENLCLAIATGIVTNILSNGTGTVTITGLPNGTPIPGGGVGQGVIT
jgi:hypothetical protein